MELQNHIRTYLNYCTEQKTLSPKTTKAYRTDLQRFSEFSRNEFTIECIREYISHEGYEMYSYERINNIRQRFDGGSMFGELLIANYDMGERLNTSRQLSLFDFEGEQDVNI